MVASLSSEATKIMNVQTDKVSCRDVQKWREYTIYHIKKSQNLHQKKVYMSFKA